MAEVLIEKGRLAVLRVRLDLSARTPVVAAELVGYPKGVLRTYAEVVLPVTAYGLAEGMDPPVRTVVPKKLLAAVRKFTKDEIGDEAALWLRLIPPYGHLGAVPWERMLVPVTERPVIRVPDRLPVAADPGRTWSVAIAVNAVPGSHWAARYAAAFTGSLESSVAVGVDIHLFTDQETHDQLRKFLPHSDPRVHLHDPRVAARVSRERTRRNVPQFRSERTNARRAESPLMWGDWIAAGLRGQALRALHLVADARFDGSRPLLAVSPDPGACSGLADCAYVSADEIRLLAETLGASTLSFGSPPDNACDVATRMLVDGIGLQRAGPTFYSDLREDPEGSAMARAHAFVAAPPGWEPIPSAPSLFGYLQPEHVAQSLHENWPDPEQPGQVWLSGRTSMGDSETSLELLPGALEAVAGEEIAALYESATYVPGWVATSERFMESKAAYLLEAAAVPGETPRMKQAYDRGVAQALGELRKLVDERARES